LESGKICYETPLNERMRTFLRLEFMFQQLDFSARGESPWDTRSALHAFFEIYSIVSRNELKSELLQELDRHYANLSRLMESPGVDPKTLAQVLQDIGTIRETLLMAKVLSQESIRRNEFLTGIRQRSSIPGGTCSFDLPAFHHWLEQNDVMQRLAYLDEWRAPLQPLTEAVGLILAMVRQSAVATQEKASQGLFQMNLDGNAPTQMTRIMVDQSASVFPEVSGGKHRFTIRFLEQPNPNSRAAQAEWDVPFELACCVI
jgi:cell division protein ZapD